MRTAEELQFGCASDGKAIGQSGNKEEERYSVEKKEDSGSKLLSEVLGMG